jgi:hypothetical protein
MDASKRRYRTNLEAFKECAYSAHQLLAAASGRG